MRLRFEFLYKNFVQIIHQNALINFHALDSNIIQDYGVTIGHVFCNSYSVDKKINQLFNEIEKLINLLVPTRNNQSKVVIYQLYVYYYYTQMYKYTKSNCQAMNKLAVGDIFTVGNCTLLRYKILCYPKWVDSHNIYL